jgi:hypothetical protein
MLNARASWAAEERKGVREEEDEDGAFASAYLLDSSWLFLILL